MAGKVLLVDPNESTQRTVELTLHAEFLEVVSVGDAAAALARARQDDISLVVSMQSLPDGTGAELLRMLRTDAATADIPTLLVGEDVALLQEAVRQGGVDGIIRVPFASKELVDQVYRLMRDPVTGAMPSSARPADADPEMEVKTNPPLGLQDGPDSAEVVDEAGQGGAGGDFFDLAGELDRGDSVAAKRPSLKLDEAEELAKEIGFGRDRTIVVSRDDLQALRNGMGMPSRGAKPAASKPDPKVPVETSHTMIMSRQELDTHMKSGKAEPGGQSEEELANYQTMMMSRDELVELRERIASGKPGARGTASVVVTPVGGVKAKEPAAASPATAPNPYAAATVRPKPSGAPGSDESIEALLRGAVHATEEELLKVLKKLKPEMADAVRRVAHELIDRVARRVALESAEKRVEEEIARIRRAAR